MTPKPCCVTPGAAGMTFTKPVALQRACWSPAQRIGPSLFAPLSNKEHISHPTVTVKICKPVFPFLSGSAGPHTRCNLPTKSQMFFRAPYVSDFCAGERSGFGLMEHPIKIFAKEHTEGASSVVAVT